MKKLFILLMSLAAALTASAQTAIRVDAPNVVGSTEQFNVTFIIEGDTKPSDFSWNPGKDFNVVWGPQQGSSTQIQIINGKRSKSSQYTFTYILIPNNTGVLQLPQATATVGSREIHSSPESIEVVADETSSGSRPSAPSADDNGYSAGDVSGQDLFLKLSLSKTNVVIGEPVTATLKLYTRVQVTGFRGAKFPTFNGFWNQEIATPDNIKFVRESLGDRIYSSAVVRRYVLIPQQPGKLSIDPAELDCIVSVRSSSRGSSIFDSFFEDETTEISKKVRTSPVTVYVSALPGGAPESFGGGVGSFKISSRLGKGSDTLKTHEAASLIVTVSGKGNVSLLEAPKVKFPADMEVYDTKMTENIEKGSGGTSGSKTFEFPFIPRSHGSFEIPPVEYSYYDSDTKKYVTLRTAPVVVNVARGEADSSSPAVSSGMMQVQRKGVKSLDNDIRHIYTKSPSLKSDSSFLVGRAVYWIIAVSLALLCAAIWFAFRHFAARRADVVGTRNRRATKMAKGRLKCAGDYMAKGLDSAFYEELHKTLLGFVSDKLNMDAEDLNKENISEKLISSGVGKELAVKYVGLIDACEYARYSPDNDAAAMQQHYDTAVEVISDVDSAVKSVKGIHTAALVVAALLCVLPLGAAPSDYPDSLWQAGIEAYQKNDWNTARHSWEGILKSGLESEYLYFNIGNSYFRMQDYPNAILNYERALKLNPSYKDAKVNLELTNSMIYDKIDTVPEFFLVTWFRNICYSLSSDTWAGISLVFFSVALAMLLLFLLAGRRGGRITGLYAGIAALLLAVAAFSFADRQRKEYISSDTAVVMSPVCTVKSSPSETSSKDLFVLHEGTKLQVIDEVGQWKNIRIADGREGWVPSADIEVI